MPESSDHRIILHIDYDCFYASVIENEQPGLRTLPLGIQQKNILATCNYVARARGVKKLQLVTEAKKVCPDLVLVNGEDLTRFRDASKKIWLHIREIIWGYKAERLGFDEVFLDVTEMIDVNIADVPSQNAGSKSGLGFFHLSQTDPAHGFSFSWEDLPALTYPADQDLVLHNSSQNSQLPSIELNIRLFLGAQLAAFLRKEIYTNFNHTASAGISTTKLTAKLVGSVNKPNKQTVLIPTATQEFLDGHEIRKIPGIGHKTTNKIRDALLHPTTKPIDTETFTDSGSAGEKVTVRDVRARLNPITLAQLLNSRDAFDDESTNPAGIGGTGGVGAVKIWGWLHGEDTSPVNPTTLIPTQISIEDTFRSLRSPSSLSAAVSAEVTSVLRQLTTKLLKRMKVDLLSPSSSSVTATKLKWMAYPLTFRLSIRLKSGKVDWSKRISKSAPLPQYVFDVDLREESIAEKLVREVVTGLFRRLIVGERVGGTEGEVDVQLLNVAVVNMAECAPGGGGGIEKLLAKNESSEKRWDEEVREIEKVYAMLDSREMGEERWNVEGIEQQHLQAETCASENNYDARTHSVPSSNANHTIANTATWIPSSPSSNASSNDSEDGEIRIGIGADAETDNTIPCPRCGAQLLVFAVEAHARFHELEGEDD